MNPGERTSTSHCNRYPADCHFYGIHTPGSHIHPGHDSRGIRAGDQGVISAEILFPEPSRNPCGSIRSTAHYGSLFHFKPGNVSPMALSPWMLVGRRLRLYGKENPGLLVLFWIAIPLALFLAMGWFPEGSWSSLLPISILVLVWVFDTFAYVIGSLPGKHPLTPILSPGKTWEGFAGGMIFSILAALLIYHFSGLESPAVWIAAGAITSIFALTGDLFESSLKRKYMVKDTGRYYPDTEGFWTGLTRYCLWHLPSFYYFYWYTFQMIRIHKEGRLIVAITLLLGMALVTISALWLPSWTNTPSVILSMGILVLVLRFFRNPVRRYFQGGKNNCRTSRRKNRGDRKYHPG